MKILKKIIIFLFIITIILIASKKEDEIVIPSESIRFRIIANSNNKEDQIIKKDLKNKLEIAIMDIEKESNNIEEAREMIKQEIPDIKKVLDNSNQKYSIKYGNNYFPEKTYKGVTYKEGEYESLVISLGEGEGNNWRCVLFPPLCLIDEDNDLTDNEYQFYISKIINKYFS